MHFLVDLKRKVIFGWSAKCGCSHVKNLFFYLTEGTIHNKLHNGGESHNLPDNIEEFIIFLFIRNPYKRVVSGFLDKYSNNGDFIKKWKLKIPLTFENFINELEKSNFEIIDKHHFTPQLSEKFGLLEQLKNKKELKPFILYDIENIDYTYLEEIYQQKIPIEVIKFRGGHEYKYKDIIDYPVYNLLTNEFKEKKPLTKCFYNENIKEKIDKFYKIDFDFFKSYDINYII
jgi:hypothetical protein